MKLTNLPPLPPRPSAPPDVSTNDIRPIKAPLDIPTGWEWLWWVLAALVLVGGLLALLWWLRRRSSRPPLIPPVPPHVRARQRLAQALGFLSDPRLFCIAVSDALRVYLEERFDLRAPERTTEEFLQDLRDTPHLNPQQKQSLMDFLERCDLVKFARFEPTETVLRDLHESALRLVDETRFEPVQAPPPAPAGEAQP